MIFSRTLGLGALAWTWVFGATSLVAGGLDLAAPISPFLDGALPSRAPTAVSGSWDLVNAFPNLVVVDPVQMIPVPGADQLLFAEKWGALVVTSDDPETSERNVILDLSAQTQVEGDSGLLGVVFHPEFGQLGSPNRDFLYVYYRYTPEPGELNRAYCRLSRYSWGGGISAIDPGSEEVLINQYDRHNWHNGGGLFFGNDGFLYLSIGDEGGVNDFYGVTQRRDGGLFSGIFRIDVDKDPSRSHPIRRHPVDAAPPPPGWSGSTTQGYFIPNDNPWLATDGSALEEYWAIGARSPHRMTIDRPTGRIWFGDVGQSREEEINLVEKADNFQWPFFEGRSGGVKPKPAPLLGTERPPVFSYGRGEGGCVIGGFVYRGSEHPSLVGKYLFGDFNNGQIRTFDDSSGEPVVESIAELGDQQLTGFGIDAAGELYLLTIGQTNLNGGIVYRLHRNGTARPQPPALLSATGAFTNLASLTPRGGLIPYDLVQALWSDGADKKRWIAIPNDGTHDSEEEQIGFSENGPWNFPIGTVLIKHFEFAGRRLETRFFVKGEDGKFFGFTYRWRADHSDADLLPGPAVDETVLLGDGRTLQWHFPARIECFECHTEAAGVVLGPKTRHLHRDLLYPATGRTANQLETLNDLGFFRERLDPLVIPGFLSSANLDDETESLDRRARSYLDINCSQCHLPGGPNRTAFDLRLTTPPNFQNLVNVVPGNGFEMADPKLIKPGDPDASIVLFRLNSLDDCCAMPPIAKNAVDADAVRILSRWIRSLDPAISPAGPTNDPPPLDLAVPEVNLSIAGGPGVDGFFTVAVEVSEPILGLTATDFLVTNGEALSLAGSGASYTLTLQPRIAGVGVVTLPADRITDLNGNANLSLAAPLVFDFEPAGSPTPNLLGNGGFEPGLTGWVAGGGVANSVLAFTGSRAAGLPALAHLHQSFAVNPLTNYQFTGWCRGVDSVSALKAAVAFWDAEGRWLRERPISLPVSAAYDSFIGRVTAPAGAVLATVTFLHSGTNVVTLDDLAVVEGGEGEPPAGPLTQNADFESGLTFWNVVNDVTLSGVTHLGQGAARIGPASSASFRRSLFPGTRVVMTGASFTEGDPVVAEAGLSFWTANDDLLGERSIPLLPSSVYQDFFFFADVPEGTARVTMWVRNGGEGFVTVDDLGLVYVADAPVGEPRAPGTGFEDDTLDPWKSGGSVSLAGVALSGTRAAVIGTASFLETSRSAIPGAGYRFGGFAHVSDDTGVHEAGLTFRDRDGVVLLERAIVLPPSSGYAAFEVVATAPPRAVSVSAWVYNGRDGAVTLDDLSLQSLPGTASMPPPAGVNAAVHVLIASLASRSDLAARDPGLHSDPEYDKLQPDLLVRANGAAFTGDDLYDLTGLRQTAIASARGRIIRPRYDVIWQNDALVKRDAALLSGSRGNRAYSVIYIEANPALRNCTAEVLAGTLQTPEAAPGGAFLYQVRLRKTRALRSQRFQAWITARSLLDATASDTVGMGLR